MNTLRNMASDNPQMTTEMPATFVAEVVRQIEQMERALVCAIPFIGYCASVEDIKKDAVDALGGYPAYSRLSDEYRGKVARENVQ